MPSRSLKTIYTGGFVLFFLFEIEPIWKLPDGANESSSLVAKEVDVAVERAELGNNIRSVHCDDLLASPSALEESHGRVGVVAESCRSV
jgi:hypothetical protein